ncbi:MAG TPA: molecular chaperone DnaK, partial [Pelotomaculum sp.]|nr:molecular chaperone DnaK [Pelotomaculum sp.]
VEIHVLQGERSMAGDNKTLGRFTLTGIPPAPRGVPQIEVKFDIDVNGIVNVSAKDMGTGKEQSMTITASTKLNDQEINNMVKEAEIHAAEDAKRKEEIDTRNQADSMVYQAEKSITDFKDKADAAAIEKLQKATDDLKEA